MARILGGDAAAGAEAVHEAVTLAENSAEVRDDLRLLPWLAVAPLFLREASTGRSLLEHALQTAGARAAVGVLPFALNLIARDQATTDRWAVAEATYPEAIGLARESGQQTELAFGLAGLAWLQARRGREAGVPGLRRRGAGAVPASWARGCLRSGPPRPWASSSWAWATRPRAVAHFEHQQQLLADLAITDPDLSPAAELVDGYLKLGRDDDAQRAAAQFIGRRARPRGSRGPLARALRCQGHAGRRRRLRRGLRARDRPARADARRVRGRAHPAGLRTSGCAGPGAGCWPASSSARRSTTFERLGARPWADRARAELAATGETRRRAGRRPHRRADAAGAADRAAARRRARPRGKPPPRCSSAPRPSSTTSATSIRDSASTPARNSRSDSAAETARMRPRSG